MTKRGLILVGMAAGLLWSVGLLWVAARFVSLPIFTLMPTIMTAFLAPGIVMLLMVGRLAQRRFFDDTIIDGAAFAPGSAADIDQRVLGNTAEQSVLALCVWPAAAVVLADHGPGVIVVLGLNFAFARLIFWAGYHLSPPLRAFGFAASFYPTVLVTLWTVLSLVAYGQ
ncbi:MAPEG family protein [Roseovarius sp. CAU 1744]|uniref:MAPEG family protein n=1 Tax=Roseovarius sp. CAU 1744 TaxID=3140368 RepID=UPI00325B5F20